MKNSGQMLIEIVVAVMVLALVLVGMLDLITRSSKVATYQKEKNSARVYVESKLNEYRKMRDDDTANFMNVIVPPKGSYKSCDFGSTIYTCEVRFTDLSEGNGVTAEVRALWTDKTTNDRSVTLSTSITYK